MNEHEIEIYDVIIIGGSFAGLSAALALGRGLRNVVIIDSGNPCNMPADRSHNFLTHDGEPPLEILKKARKDVGEYSTVHFIPGCASFAENNEGSFRVTLDNFTFYSAKKLIIASGIKDILPAPELKGFNTCWGSSILQCPYCHGYEYKGKPTGIIAKGDSAFEYAKMINNWTANLKIFTNGAHELNSSQMETLSTKHIPVIEKKISSLEHADGLVKYINFEDGSREYTEALYASLEYEQSNSIASKLGCKLDEKGHIIVDERQQTSVNGVYAAGDAASAVRAISLAVASGTTAGFAVNKDLIDEEF